MEVSRKSEHSSRSYTFDNALDGLLYSIVRGPVIGTGTWHIPTGTELKAFYEAVDCGDYDARFADMEKERFVFEAREVAEYGESLQRSALVSGETYLYVEFLDNARIVPYVVPVEYGDEIEDETRDHLFTLKGAVDEIMRCSLRRECRSEP